MTDHDFLLPSTKYLIELSAFHLVLQVNNLNDNIDLILNVTCVM